MEQEDVINKFNDTDLFIIKIIIIVFIVIICFFIFLILFKFAIDKKIIFKLSHYL